jgi:phosphoglycerate dehydrogenase-like enzyme
MTQQIVVGLGPVTPDTVQPVLGAGISFISEPTAEDLERAMGAIVRAAYVVDKAAMDAMPHLKVIARTGVGYDLVDVATADARGIAVAITPGSNSQAVAEGVMAHILHLVKRLAPLHSLVVSGKFAERTRYSVGDLEGATIGILGFGRIGSRVAHLASAFGMKVLAYDPFVTIPSPYKSADIAEVLRASDVLTLHMPLTEENRNLINAPTIATMKDGAVLVNCSRGALIDLDAAFAALNIGKLGGLGVDVFDPEPPVHHPIFDLENVLLTPHVMGLTVKATEATFIDAARAVRVVLDGQEPDALVNSIAFSQLQQIQKKSE